MMFSPSPAIGRSPKKGKACDCLQHTETGPIAQPRCMRCFGTGVTDTRRDATLKKNLKRRIPTFDEMRGFTGAHCGRLYASLAFDWRCPSCNRSKYELLRWTMLFPHTPQKFLGWAGGLHRHHDHGADAGTARERFPETPMCEQCNNADTSAKRELALPANFSFSPAEISRFIIAIPHGWHLLNYAAAQREYIGACRLGPPPPPGHFWWTGGQP